MVLAESTGKVKNKYFINNFQCHIYKLLDSIFDYKLGVFKIPSCKDSCLVGDNQLHSSNDGLFLGGES